jgi:hypothetical protein
MLFMMGIELYNITKQKECQFKRVHEFEIILHPPKLLPKSLSSQNTNRIE